MKNFTTFFSSLIFFFFTDGVQFYCSSCFTYILLLIIICFLNLVCFLFFAIVLLLYFLFSFFFHTLLLAGSWFISQRSGLSSCGRNALTCWTKKKHQTPGNINQSEVFQRSTSKHQSIFSQRLAKSFAGTLRLNSE